MLSGGHALVADFGIARAAGGSREPEADPDRHGDRYAALHEPRAGGGRQRRTHQRYLQPGLRAVRNADRAAAVHRPQLPGRSWRGTRWSGARASRSCATRCPTRWRTRYSPRWPRCRPTGPRPRPQLAEMLGVPPARHRGPADHAGQPRTRRGQYPARQAAIVQSNVVLRRWIIGRSLGHRGVCSSSEVELRPGDSRPRTAIRDPLTPAVSIVTSRGAVLRGSESQAGPGLSGGRPYRRTDQRPERGAAALGGIQGGVAQYRGSTRIPGQHRAGAPGRYPGHRQRRTRKRQYPGDRATAGRCRESRWTRQRSRNPRRIWSVCPTAVAQQAAVQIRKRIGQEVQLSRTRAGTRNTDAWSKYQRAAQAQRAGRLALQGGQCRRILPRVPGSRLAGRARREAGSHVDRPDRAARHGWPIGDPAGQ